MNKSEKEQIINAIAEKVTRAKGLFLTDYTGITVEHATELRREFRKVNVDYRVVKNTLARKALEQVTGYDKIYDRLAGPTGLAISYNDPAAPARVIKKFHDKHENFQLKIAVLEGSVYDGNRLSELAALPSRAEMVASILGSLDAPITGLVGTIGAVMRDLVNVIDQIEKQKAA